MLDLTMAIVAHTLFTQQAEDYDTAEIERLLVVILDGIAQRMFLTSSLSLLEKLPIPSNRRFDAAQVRLRQIMEPIIQSYRTDRRDRGDMLSTLLLAQDQEDQGGLTDKQVQDQCTETAITAYETTGVTLSWFFHELGRNPDVERRIHTEVDAVLAGRRPGLADVAALEYTRRAITETLRLHHPIWVSMRRTCSPMNLGGADIATGVELLFSPYALHRDPVLFSNPLTFDPERWLQDRAGTRSRHAFLPFGAGRRVCIGESFALTAMTLAIATIASRWQLRPLPGHVVRERPHLAVHADRLLMTAVPRHPLQ
jgi:pentalenene oxygenase